MSIAKKLLEVAQNVSKVYEAGYAAGQNESGGGDGYYDGYEQGKRDERDAFWDMFQENGARLDYQRAFSAVWTDNLFKPKYDISPTNANQMFLNSKITNLKKLLEDAGVSLDTSKTKFITQMFQSSTITHLPAIDCTAAGQVSAVFSDMLNLVYIEKVVVKESHTFPNAFSSAKALVEIRVEGVIANDIGFQWSPLSKESIESIVGCLSDSASGKTASFKKTAVLAAFGSEANWTAYIAAKPNWNFALA